MGLRLGFSLHQQFLPVSSLYAMTLNSFRGEHQDSLLSILASDLHQTGPRTYLIGQMTVKRVYHWYAEKLLSQLSWEIETLLHGPPVRDQAECDLHQPSRSIHHLQKSSRVTGCPTFMRYHPHQFMHGPTDPDTLELPMLGEDAHWDVISWAHPSVWCNPAIGNHLQPETLEQQGQGHFHLLCFVDLAYSR